MSEYEVLTLPSAECEDPGDDLEEDPLLGGDLLVVNWQYSFSLAVWFLNDFPHLYFIELTSDSDFDFCLKF